MAYTIENYFLTVLEAGKSKIRVPARPVSGENSSWLTDSPLLTVSSLGLSSVLMQRESERVL